ncbi:MAG: glycosyltransferase family 4 protein [Alphaproteobacteria bacterium]|nr:glycosyltransferase family 4 protein [Alphaproteobacteria bacterium]
MMRVAFYSPMSEPDATVASGTQRMGALLQRALALSCDDVVRPRLPRTFDGRGDRDVQISLQAASHRAGAELLEAYRDGTLPKPDLWFSYHVYYKSPDWIGPVVARELGIPYVVAEGSHAPKRAGGPWALGHEGATAALRAADRLLAMTAFDRFCLDQLAPGRVRDLKPFFDAIAFANARRAEPAGVLHLLAVAMMRNERKRASFALLADALKLLDNVPLTLSIAGDGAYRREIEAMFLPCAPLHTIRFLGAVAAEQMPRLMSGADVFCWPGLGEAYGLVFLEAQAAGLPVVACRDRGVPDATREDQTTLLSAPGDAAAYAANLRRVLSDMPLRRRLGENGRVFVQRERSVEAAAGTLRSVLAELGLR